MELRPRKALLAAAVVLLALPAAPGAAAPASAEVAYHVSPSGDDDAAGTTPSTAWRTLARAGAATLRPGDMVLLEGGVTHRGSLVFDASDGGTATAPVVVTGYGAGRPRIDAGDGTAIRISDTGGIAVRDLDISGSGRTTNTGSGVSAYNWATSPTLAGISVTDVTARGFGAWGVIIGSDRAAGGYAGVRIDRVDASANGEGGILTWAGRPRAHRDVRITRSRAFSNPGVPGMRKNSGNGIVIGSAAGGLIERCVAAYNGGLNDYAEGGAGIWTYDSDGVVIQHNESHSNRTGGPTDGDGFDLDQNTTNAVVQHNYSHDNDGAGYLLAHGPAGGSHKGNVVRFNVSENDGRRNGYGAITLWGRITDTEISRNTVVVGPAPKGRPLGISIVNWTVPDRDVADVSVRGNIVATSGGLPLLRVTASQLDGAQRLRFEGNAWAASGSTFALEWGARTYSSLSGWRRNTGQETVDGVSTGFRGNPRLVAPGAGVTFDDPERLGELTGYRLRPDSPLIDRGVAFPSTMAVTTDFFGRPAVAGAGPDIGAAEH